VNTPCKLTTLKCGAVTPHTLQY